MRHSLQMSMLSNDIYGSTGLPSVWFVWKMTGTVTSCFCGFVLFLSETDISFPQISHIMDVFIIILPRLTAYCAYSNRPSGSRTRGLQLMKLLRQPTAPRDTVSLFFVYTFNMQKKSEKDILRKKIILGKKGEKMGFLPRFRKYAARHVF